MRYTLIKLIKGNKGFLLFICLMFVFRSSFADWNTVPTGSMKPTIQEGDRILVNKMAYDIRLPFSHISLYKMADPERGDIVIFDSKVSQKRLVKRVIGIPGDTVELNRNILFINGKKLEYQKVATTEYTEDRLESLETVIHAIRVNNAGSMLSSFAPVKIPAGYYLVLGDNRDNSADSRVIGLIPRNEFVGRSRTVVVSLDYDNYYIPRADRFFRPL